jgi:anti-sigma B factor antagonist
MPVWASPEVTALLSVTVSRGTSSAYITVVGEVDAYSARQLTAALGAVTEVPQEVTVDLNGVTFLDSAGVHALAAAYRRASAVGARLQVVTSRRAVLRPLQLSGLWQLLSGDARASG